MSLLSNPVPPVRSIVVSEGVVAEVKQHASEAEARTYATGVETGAALYMSAAGKFAVHFDTDYQSTAPADQHEAIAAALAAPEVVDEPAAEVQPA